MQAKSGQVHVFGLCGAVKNGKYMFELLYILSGDLTAVCPLKKALKSFVSEALYHKTIVYGIYAIVKVF